jgi:hypothetical protein
MRLSRWKKRLILEIPQGGYPVKSAEVTDDDGDLEIEVNVQPR